LRLLRRGGKQKPRLVLSLNPMGSASHRVLSPRWVSNLFRISGMQYRDFRFLWLSTIFTQTGIIGELVTVSWLVLERTDSPFMVGLALGVRMAPQLLVGVPAGALADRFDRRVLMRLLNLFMAVAIGLLGLLLLVDVAGLWLILVVAFAMGGLRAMLQATRQSFAYDIVGPEHAIRGLAFVTLAMRLGMLSGSLIAGFGVDRFGAGVSFLLLASSYLVAVLLLLPLRSRGQAAPDVGTSWWHNMREHLSELRHNRSLLMLVIIASSVEFFGFSHQVLLPSIARDVLHIDAAGLGVLHAFRSVGGILGIILLSVMGEVHRKGLLLLTVLPLFGLAVMSLGWVETLVTVSIAVTVINVLSTTTDVLTQTLMQRSVPNHLRGRAMGSWVLAIGTAPAGQLQVGAIASLAGISAALTLSGLGLVALSGVAAVAVKRLRTL
jgi:MFS family permease